LKLKPIVPVQPAAPYVLTIQMGNTPIEEQLCSCTAG